jgi:hypothetical protein
LLSASWCFLDETRVSTAPDFRRGCSPTAGPPSHAPSRRVVGSPGRTLSPSWHWSEAPAGRFHPPGIGRKPRQDAFTLLALVGSFSEGVDVARRANVPPDRKRRRYSKGKRTALCKRWRSRKEKGRLSVNVGGLERQRGGSPRALAVSKGNRTALGGRSTFLVGQLGGRPGWVRRFEMLPLVQARPEPHFCGFFCGLGSIGRQREGPREGGRKKKKRRQATRPAGGREGGQ